MKRRLCAGDKTTDALQRAPPATVAVHNDDETMAHRANRVDHAMVLALV